MSAQKATPACPVNAWLYGLHRWRPVSCSKGRIILEHDPVRNRFPALRSPLWRAKDRRTLSRSNCNGPKGDTAWSDSRMWACDTGWDRRFCATSPSVSSRNHSSSLPALRARARPRCCGCCSCAAADPRADHRCSATTPRRYKDSLAALRRRIGIVFQDFRLLDHMTAYENVALPFRVMGKEEASYRDEVIEMLQWVGLGDRWMRCRRCCRAARSSAPPSRAR